MNDQVCLKLCTPSTSIAIINAKHFFSSSFFILNIFFLYCPFTIHHFTWYFLLFHLTFILHNMLWFLNDWEANILAWWYIFVVIVHNIFATFWLWLWVIYLHHTYFLLQFVVSTFSIFNVFFSTLFLKKTLKFDKIHMWKTKEK